jgi:hypothetical protein
MKLTIHEIRKETCRLLGSYFGLGVENILRKTESGIGTTNPQTPESYNGRVNNMTRKNLGSNRRPQ